MPNLQHLLDDLKDLGILPKMLHLPGQLFDSLLSDAEDANDEDEDEDE